MKHNLIKLNKENAEQDHIGLRKLKKRCVKALEMTTK